MTIVLLLIFLAGIVCLMFYTAILTDSLLGGYDFATNRQAILKIAEILETKRGNLYDLGSARGNFIVKLVKLVPSLNYFGVDNNLFRVHISRLRVLFLGKHIKFLHESIYNTDVRKADVVYIYLDKSLLPRLETKLRRELKEGTLVITNTHKFPTWQPLRTYIANLQDPETQKLFVYIK